MYNPGCETGQLIWNYLEQFGTIWDTLGSEDEMTKPQINLITVYDLLFIRVCCRVCCRVSCSGILKWLIESARAMGYISKWRLLCEWLV